MKCARPASAQQQQQQQAAAVRGNSQVKSTAVTLTHGTDDHASPAHPARASSPVFWLLEEDESDNKEDHPQHAHDIATSSDFVYADWPKEDFGEVGKRKRQQRPTRHADTTGSHKRCKAHID